MNEEKTLLENELQNDETLEEENVQDALPQEETTVEETPAEEVPAEDVPAEDAPAEDAPAEEKTTEAPAEPLIQKAPYHERYYLRYNGGEKTEALDLDGTRSFLQAIGFDGGELAQARKEKDRSQAFNNPDQNKKNQMYCSYCGAEIAGVEYYRLPDGRLRCTACSRSIVTNKDEIQEMCRRVVANMDNFFGATIDVPVSVEVLDEVKLKKKIGVPLGTQDDQSMLILGVAINKKNQYRILLENGAPRISLIATFAHELTHIWQYTHWDNNNKLAKCPQGNRLLIYEGMAKWAEIQYLYLVGETNIARREEYITRNRQDEYGIGFCLYEDNYPLSRETMVCEETPFTPDRYPFESPKED